jgi:hypothetical protein
VLMFMGVGESRSIQTHHGRSSMEIGRVAGGGYLMRKRKREVWRARSTARNDSRDHRGNFFTFSLSLSLTRSVVFPPRSSASFSDYPQDSLNYFTLFEPRLNVSQALAASPQSENRAR